MQYITNNWNTTIDSIHYINYIYNKTICRCINIYYYFFVDFNDYNWNEILQIIIYIEG